MTVTAPEVADVVLPGSGARLRSTSGVAGPQDVPLWMIRGGASARAAAAALSGDAVAVRRAGQLLTAVLGDTAGALGWAGPAALAAADDSQALQDRLSAAARELEAAAAALGALAAALEARRDELDAVRSSWLRTTDQAQRSALQLRWQAAVGTLDTVDQQVAQGLRRVAGALTRLAMAQPDVGTVPGSGAGGPRGGAAGRVSRLADGVWHGTLAGLGSFGDAAGSHPGAVLEILAGAYLIHAGAGGELAGTALDLTGAGAVVGVPVNVASAGLVLTGAGLMTMGAAELGSHAAGNPARGGDPAPIDVSEAGFAQRTASERFSTAGTFKGRLVDDVADDLRHGRLTPEDVPINVIRREGKVLILNTRSSVALERAGIPRSRWHVVDRTGHPGHERRLNRQLSRNRLDVNGVDVVALAGGEGL